MGYCEDVGIDRGGAWTVQQLIDFLETVPKHWRVLTRSWDYDAQPFCAKTIEKLFQDEELLIFVTE